MFPTLFDSSWIGLEGALHFTIPTYFAAILTGFAGAAWLAYRDAQLQGVDEARFRDFAIWMLIIGVLGSRVFHVLFDGFLWDYIHLATDPLEMLGRPLESLEPCTTNAQCLADQQAGRDVGGICHPDDGLCYPQPDPFRWLKFWAGGLTVYGGLLGCVAFATYYIRKHEMGLGRIFDLGGYAIFFGIFVGRLGCLAAGCCFGEVCDIEAVAVQFPQGSLAYQHHLDFHHAALTEQWQSGVRTSLPVWPTQFISSAYSLGIFLFAYFVVRPRKRFHGQVLAVGALLYALARFSIEFIRADFRGEYLGLSTSQLVSLVVAAGAVAVLVWGLRRAAGQREPRTETPDA